MSENCNITYTSRGRRGLTLVELCVGVAALSGLLAAVLPVVHGTRQNSMSAACRDKLARIQAAALVYAGEDSTEFVIPIGIGDAYSSSTYASPYSYGGRSGWGKTPVGGDISNSLFAGSPLYLMGSMHRPLNRLLYKRPLPLPPVISSGRGGMVVNLTYDARLDLDIFQCPQDIGFPGMHHRAWRDSGLSSYEFYGTSYATVPLFVGLIGESWIKSFSAYAHKVSAIPAPSTTVTYLENAARFAFMARNDSLDQSLCGWPYPAGNQTAHGWHGMDFQFNVAFVDGAVRNISMRGYGRTPGAYCPAMAVGCECAVVRGEGWRFDVAPAPLAFTSKTITGGGGGGSTTDWDVVE